LIKILLNLFKDFQSSLQEEKAESNSRRENED